MKVNINKRIIRYIVLYITAFFMVYESGSLPSIISINDLWLDKMLLFIPIGIIALSALKTKANWTSLFIWTMIFMIFIILNSVVCIDTTTNLIYRLLIFLSIYLCVLYTELRNINFETIICHIIVFFAFTSAIIYLCVYILKVPIPHSFFYLGKNGLRYFSYGGIYYDQGYSNIQFGMNLNRMTGPFWEPGVYQIFLNYALYRYVVIEKSNKFVIALLLFDIFFTMSASGWLCAIVIIVIGIAKSPKFTNKSKIFIFIFLSLFGGIATKFVLFSKFSETFSNKSSAYIRMNDFLLGLKIFIENPILGIGFNNTEPFMMRNTYNDTGILGSSNGFMTIAYTTGIVGMVFVLLPFIYNIIKRKKKRYKSVLYFIMIVFFNFSEPVYYFPFMMYILVKEYRKAFKNSTLSI